MNKSRSFLATVLATFLLAIAPVLAAAQAKPNILFIVSDDTGYGDLGPYGGGEGRGMRCGRLIDTAKSRQSRSH